MSAELEGRIRQLERELDELRSTTQRDREQLAALTRDLSELTVALRELRTSLDTWWRDRWPTLEGRLGRIEATVDGVSQRVAAPPNAASSATVDWRVLGLIAAAIFGGGLTVGGGAGAGLVPLMQQAPAGK
ncbi:MAG: hypothetical protein ACO3O1_04680 [Ilumatobacteraceae bacterium]